MLGSLIVFAAFGAVYACAIPDEPDSSANYPADAGRIAGFTMMHALWSISDLPKGESLVPLAVAQDSAGKMQLFRFPGEDSRKCVIEGTKHLESLRPKPVAWALAYDTILHTKDGSVDCIVVLAHSDKTERVLLVSQAYEPFVKRNHFRLIGDLGIAIDERQVESGRSHTIIADVRQGMHEHPKSDLLPKWK